MQQVRTTGFPNNAPLRLSLSVALSAVVIALAMLAYVLEAWDLLRVPEGPAIFMDLRTLTATAHCVTLDSQWSMESLPCSSLGTPYNYPSFLAEGLSVLGVTEASTETLGIVLAVAFALGLGLLMYTALRPRTSLLTPAFVAVSAVSPASFLAIERGNYDTVVFSVLTVAGALAVGRKSVLAAVAIGIAGSLKLYAFGGGLVFAVKNVRTKAAIATLVIVAAISLVLLRADIATMIERTPQTTTMSFGSAVGILRLASMYDRESALGIDFSDAAIVSIARIAGAAALILISLVLLLYMRICCESRLAKSTRDLGVRIIEDRVSEVFLLVGGGTFIASYLGGTNFNYRLIFLVFVVMALVRAGGTPGFSLAAGLIAVQYLYTAAPQVVAPFIDVLLLVLTSLLLVIVVQVLLRGVITRDP